MKVEKTYFADAASVKIESPFWCGILEKLRNVTLPDILLKFEKSGAFDNFRIVPGGSGGKPTGKPYYDGLIYEVIRGASDLLGDRYDEALDKQLDDCIDLILQAQLEDGYISTYTANVMPDCRFGMNGGVSYWQHDIYNAGAFIDAGVHHYIATGKKKLLKAAVRFANYMCGIIGYPPKMNIVPDHSLAEEAMLKLHILFAGDKELAAELNADAAEYLLLSQFWIDNRGVHKDRASYPRSLMQYAQDSTPLRREDEAVGHAVRGVLLYSAAAALSRYTGDEELKVACERLWHNVIETKMHITGGVGVNRSEECFGFQYQLPNNAYLETCASVGFAFWAANTCLLTGEAGIMDYFERALYNNVLGCLSAEGNKYFYENPLISDGDSERWEWHPVPCCPPMLLKLFSALKTYIYSFEEDTIKVQLYSDSKLSREDIKITQKNRVFDVKTNNTDIRHISFRVPGYAENFEILMNGEKLSLQSKKGYLTVPLSENGTAEIRISFDTPVIRLEGHPYIKPADAGLGVRKKVAVMRGPVVYCAEGVDNGGDVDFSLAKEPSLFFNADEEAICGTRTDGKTFRLIPFYSRANRGKTPMRVWLNQSGMPVPTCDPGWNKKLYRKYTG